ncbi:ATP-binding protein [Paraburkholderia bryophila]|uniref:ORC1/DEAH AAA+ ATPase domain-containing protein n=1 Tax=Paraburkholderia bryophila TaxID=420952 RepID=A0A7Y9WQ20_9BURK|nr:ATP-binding protein [Paraburkholderia bryophila]NYH23828.1 hypothetical protein [Paraburkholderia bryophila]
MKPGIRIVSTAPGVGGDSVEMNPLLIGFPDPLDDSSLVQRLAFNPFYSRTWRERNRDPSRLRDYLQSVFVPTPTTIEATRRMLLSIRNGYLRRDPAQPNCWSEYFRDERGAPPSVQFDPRHPAPIAIIGITGVGKSHLVGRALSLLPPPRKHEALSTHLASVVQIPFIYIHLGTVDSLLGLIVAILTQIDEVLGVSSYGDVGRQPNVDVLIDRAIRILKTHFCGAVVLEEVQYLNFGHTSASARVRNFMLKLSNAGIPLILVGNPLGFQFKEKNGTSSQLLRRLKDNAIRLEPAEAASDDEWRYLIRGLWPCQLLENRAKLTDEWYDLLYRITGGFPAFLISLLDAAQQLAMRRGHRSLSSEIVVEAANADRWLKRQERMMIDAFVAKDPVRLREFSDIDHLYYRDKWTSNSDPLPLADMPRTHETSQRYVEAGKMELSLKPASKAPREKVSADPAAVQTRQFFLGALDQMLGQHDESSLPSVDATPKRDRTA